MISTRTIVAPLLAAGCLALPTAASAETYCVNAQCANPRASLQLALDSAAAHGGSDTVFLGRAPEGNPYRGAFHYASGEGLLLTGTVADVTIQGAGADPALRIAGGGNATVANLTIRAADVLNAVGLELTGATGRDLEVSAKQGTAVFLQGGLLLSSEVSAPEGSGTSASGTGNEIADSRISGEVAADATFARLAISHSRLAGERAGILVVGDASAGTRALDLTASEVTTSAPSSVGIGLQATRLARIERSTIASTSNAPSAYSTGIALDAITGSASLQVEGSIIAGYRHGLNRRAAETRRADLDVQRSEWAPAGDQQHGEGTLRESGNAHAEPRFADRLAGDLRLRGSDRAIDLTGLHAAGTDLDGRTALDGDGNGSALVDAGAHEYLRTLPELTLTAAPTSGRPGAPLAFAAETGDVDGEDVRIGWSFGDGTTASGPAASHAYAQPGTYTVTATALDEGGAFAERTATLQIAAPGGGTPATPSPSPSPTGSPSPSPTPAPADTPAPATATPAADTAAPELAKARVVRRRGRAILKLRASEPSQLALAFRHRHRTVALAAGPARIALGRFPRLRVRLRATDAAGNRSALLRLRLKAR